MTNIEITTCVIVVVIFLLFSEWGRIILMIVVGLVFSLGCLALLLMALSRPSVIVETKEDHYNRGFYQGKKTCESETEQKERQLQDLQTCIEDCRNIRCAHECM